MKRYIAERTNKAEIRPKEQREKADNRPDNLCYKIHLKRPLRQKKTQEENKEEWASWVGLCQKHKP